MFCFYYVMNSSETSSYWGWFSRSRASGLRSLWFSWRYFVVAKWLLRSAVRCTFQEGIRRKYRKEVLSISEKQSFPGKPSCFPRNLGQLSLVGTNCRSYSARYTGYCTKDTQTKQLGNLAICPLLHPTRRGYLGKEEEKCRYWVGN